MDSINRRKSKFSGRNIGSTSRRKNNGGSDQNNGSRNNLLKRDRNSQTPSASDSSSSQNAQQECHRIVWQGPSSDHRGVTTEAEEALLPILLRFGKKERGMMKNQSYGRVRAIRNACRQHGMRMDQALSLRRTHMMYLNPQIKSPSGLRLGLQNDIKRTADLFEESVAEYLRQQGIPFLTENDQRSMVKPDEMTPPTPDFLFFQKTVLQTHDRKKNHEIKWIEAKMFYGAATIPHGTKNAVGGLMRTAKRYLAAHGVGAFVFSFGYSSRLKEELESEGVLVLDANPLDVRKMEAEQRKWCGKENGHILP